MSRSGYQDDCSDWELICYRGAVSSAMNGRRGQAFLKEMLTTLDAMPEKNLITGDLKRDDGSVCVLGAVGDARKLDMGSLDPEDAESMAKVFDIAPSFAREIVFMNDEFLWLHWNDDPNSDGLQRQRWTMMRNWVNDHIIKEAA